jgi:hypothetical protein
MLHLLQETVNPRLGLGQCLSNWEALSFDLREPRRRRTLQAAELEQPADLLS